MPGMSCVLVIPALSKWGQVDGCNQLAKQSSLVLSLRSQKTRWTDLKNDTWGSPLSSICTCTYVYLHLCEHVTTLYKYQKERGKEEGGREKWKKEGGVKADILVGAQRTTPINYGAWWYSKQAKKQTQNHVHLVLPTFVPVTRCRKTGFLQQLPVSKDQACQPGNSHPLSLSWVFMSSTHITRRKKPATRLDRLSSHTVSSILVNHLQR